MSQKCTGTSKRTGKKCRDWAMKGKDKCYHHGGATPIYHGLYSKYAKTLLADKIKEAKDDPELLDITKDIAFIRSLVVNLLEKCEESGRLDGESRDKLADFTMKIGALIEKHKRVTEGYKVRIEVVGLFIERVMEVVERRIDESRIKESILRDLQEIRLPSGGQSAEERN